MRSPAGLILAASAALAGCVPPATPPTQAPTSARRPEPAPVPPPPPKVEPAKPAEKNGPTKQPPAFTVRELDRAAFDELEKAYSDNPLRAETAYAGVRWLIRGKVVHIGTGRGVELLVPFTRTDTHCFDVAMWDRREAEKLTLDRESAVLGTFKSGRTAGVLEVGVSGYGIDLHFVNGTAP